MPRKRSQALDDKILERLAEGALMTVLCRDEKMPSIRQLQRWRKDDAEFDDKCWSAEGQGLMVQRSEFLEQMMDAVKNGGPGSGIAIQGLRELLHENGRTSGRLVQRMSDRQHLRIDSKEEQVIRFCWDDGKFNVCPECGYEDPDHIIDVNPVASLPDNTTNTERGYIDLPQRSIDPSAEDADPDSRVDVVS